MRTSEIDIVRFFSRSLKDGCSLRFPNTKQNFHHRATQQNTPFSGPARQMGAGGGLGAFAMRMGRAAIPVVRKYILPVAKQVGKNLLKAAIPEIGHVLTGKKRPSGEMLKNVAEAAAKRTVKTTASAA